MIKQSPRLELQKSPIGKLGLSFYTKDCQFYACSDIFRKFPIECNRLCYWIEISDEPLKGYTPFYFTHSLFIRLQRKYLYIFKYFDLTGLSTRQFQRLMAEGYEPGKLYHIKLCWDYSDPFDLIESTKNELYFYKKL